MGFDVVTLDKEMKWKPDICVDVLQWEYYWLQPGQLQVIYAPPLCTEYSQALTTRPRDLKAADAVLWRTLKSIRHFRPAKWLMENPRGGRLPQHMGDKEYPLVDVDY